MKTRTAGLIAACGIAAASLGLIVYLATRAAPAPTAPTATGPTIAPPDIKDLPTTPRGPDTDAIMGGTGLFVQVMDRRDPTRLSSEIISTSLEPLEAKNYRVEQPRAWIYLRDGRVVHVQSKQGRLHMPDRTREPDSGTLQGEVDIRLFAPPAPGSRIDLAKDEPLVRARTETLNFDGSLGEVSTPDPIKITSARTTFDGTGLRLLLNQAQERIEMLRVERDGVLRHRPKPAEAAAPPELAASPESPKTAEIGGEPTSAAAGTEKTATPPAAQATAPVAVPAPGEPAAPATPPRETFYHATFAGPVKVVQGSRSISEAAQLEVWAHVIDNELAPGAIGGDAPEAVSAPEPAPLAPPADVTPESEPAVSTPAPATTETSGAAEPGAAETPPTAITPPTEPATTETGDVDGEVVMTWPGVMEVRPLEARPEELAQDGLALRFNAGPGGSVIGLDTESGATATAERITYNATRRAVALTDRSQARLERPGQGHLSAPLIEIGTATGVVNIPAGGELVAATPPGKAETAPRSLTWTDNAQFQFDVADGTMTDQLRRATLIGGVVAMDRGASLKGGLVQAWLAPDAEGRSAMQRLLVREQAAARDAKGGSLDAGTLDVTFAPAKADEDPTPRTVAASGNVRAQRDGSSIECGELEAQLRRDAEGEIEAEKVAARGDVKFARDDGVRATADELQADAIKQIVDLTGENASVGKDADIVHGSQIRLDGVGRSLEVFGPGRFEHQAFDPAGLPLARADAAWTKGMTFSDRTGELDADGQVVAVNQPDPLSVETIRAERIKLRLTPLDESEASAVALEPGPADQPQPARELLFAEALGSDLERDDGVRANAELRRYATAADRDAGTAPTRLQYLESSRIQVDNRAGTLHTPGPGKLLVVDRRRDAVPAAPEAGGSPETSRGDALFEWAQSMTMNRADGTCRMERGVKMTHAALAGGELTELECESLTARIREAAGDAEPAVDLAGGTREVDGRLVEADAAGAVFIRSQGKELLADGVKYQAERRTIEAWANPGSVVTLFDPTNPNPLTARRLMWDLTNNRIEVRESGTLIAPR